MKTIVLVPVKNESWILRSSLKNFSDFADHIIVADQNSTDGCIDIYKEFPKVTVITNNEIGHGNKVRWNLLDEARKINGNNLIVCIDADEMISPGAIEAIQQKALESITPISFEFSWIQLWKSISEHRTDGVWKDNRKTIAFIDDRKIDYDRSFVLNDHTGRIPITKEKIFIPEYPLLHFQYVAWDQNQLKQAWYRCTELLAGNEPRRINLKYSITFEGSKTKLETVPTEWLSGIPTELSEVRTEDDWHYIDIIKWFSEKGVEFFEPLEIWHIPELYDIFVKQTGRLPKPKKFPTILIAANNLKNKIKNALPSR